MRERALSTHLFVNRRLTPALLQALEDVGLPAVEIFCARQHFDYADLAQVRQLAGWFADRRLSLRSLHSPMVSDTEWGRSGPRAVVNLADPDRLRRRESVDQVKRALEVAERIPFRFLVQHLGVPAEDFAPAKFDAAAVALEELRAFAAERGVEILPENIPNSLSTPERLLAFSQAADWPAMRVCFDTGHAHLAGGVEADFEALSGRAASVHVHDNRGDRDDHLFPFQGTIDWEATARGLAALPAEVPLQLELRDYGEFPDPLARALESFHRLEELASVAKV